MKARYQFLNKYIYKYKNKFFVALTFLILETMGDLIQPTIMSKIIDNGVKMGDMQYVLKLGSLMLLMTALGASFAVTRNIVSSKVSQSFGADLREDLYIKIQNFSFDNIDKFQDASLIIRLTNDVNQIQNFSHGLMRIFVKAPVLGIGSVVMAFMINPKLALIPLGIIPIIGYIILLNLRISYPIFTNIQRALDKVNGVLREYLAGIRVVKAFNRYTYETKRFKNVNEGLKDISLRGMRIIAIFNPIVTLMVNIGIVLVLWFGGLRVDIGDMEVGQIMAFVNYMTQTLFSLMMMTRILNVFIRAKASAERIAEVFEEENTILEKDSPSKFDNIQGKVDFNHVYFKYHENGKSVLEDISFSVSPGKTVAIIGSTGSGKSTLINLIPRFYDCSHGNIKIDGINIKDIKLDKLRENIAIVPQKTLLFTGSIKENIKWGNKDAKDEDVEEVAKISQAHDFISTFNDGYDTYLGQGGVNLSGGQKQRVSIARGPAGIAGARGVIMPPKKAKNIRDTLKRLWDLFKDEKKQLIVTFLIIMAAGLLGLVVPFLIGKAVDTMFLGKSLVDLSSLKFIVLTLLVIYIVDNILIFFQEYLVAGIGQRLVFNLREDMFKKLQVLPIIFFDRNPHGEIMSRLSNDIDNISTTVSQTTVQFMSSAVTIIGSLIMMLYLSPIMTLASMVTIPLVYILTRIIANKTRVLFREQQKTLGMLNAHIEETIGGIHVIKAFNNEEKVINEFIAQNNVLRDVGVKAQIWSGFIMPLMNVINNFGFGVIAIVGGTMAVQGMISVGVIASFISYSKQFTRPLNELANTFNTLQSGIAGAERVFEILDEKEEREDNADAIISERIRGEVEFKNVTFEYKEGEPVLKNVSFKVESGTNIALVGPTGAGKTTIVNILTGFYEIPSGEILIDGINVKDYKKDSLRRIFGMVLQDTYLFSGTIKENIKYGNLYATDDEIKKAAILARADDFINKLSNGYETLLNEGGTNLSQGQRQLLAIARAILSDPSILVLDEATSSVDTRTELKIQDAMVNLMENRTTFIIAHRLSTIKDADTIMVIDHGEIVEFGNHNQLMARKGHYYNLHISQFANLEI